MSNHWKLCVLATVSSIAVSQLWAQSPRVAILDIEWGNAVVYIDDVADPSKLVTSPNPVTPSTRNFMTFTAIGDIVSVNGRPAKGTFVDNGRLIQLVRSPTPGQAISDLALRGGMVDIHLEILDSVGTPVGSIMTSGFTGGVPVPNQSGRCCSLAVTGGTGAFQGVRGTVAGSLIAFRPTSMAEDPANRRINGGTGGHWFASLIPIEWPDIVTDADGPAIFHADFSPVTAAKPAHAGELLIVAATGLGSTIPATDPGKPFPSDPLAVVNSPLEVTVNGNAADVVNKAGWPGTTDTYRLDIRVPNGTSPGMAALQVTAAFIAGGEVKIPIQ